MAENLSELIEEAKAQYLENKLSPEAVSFAQSFEMTPPNAKRAFELVAWASEFSDLTNDDARQLQDMVLNFPYLPPWERVCALTAFFAMNTEVTRLEKRSRRRQRKKQKS
jgi:hypothetical protein